MLPPSRDAAAGLGGADEAPSGSLAALPEYALSVQPPDGAAVGGRSWSVGDSMRKLEAMRANALQPSALQAETTSQVKLFAMLTRLLQHAHAAEMQGLQQMPSAEQPHASHERVAREAFAAVVAAKAGEQRRAELGAEQGSEQGAAAGAPAAKAPAAGAPAAGAPAAGAPAAAEEGVPTAASGAAPVAPLHAAPAADAPADPHAPSADALMADAPSAAAPPPRPLSPLTLAVHTQAVLALRAAARKVANARLRESARALTAGDPFLKPFQFADTHPFSPYVAPRFPHTSEIDSLFSFFLFADTPPFPHMSHPVSPICQKLVLFFLN